MVWVTTNLDTNLVIPADSHILIGQLQGDIAGHHRSMFPEHGSVSCVRLIMSVTTAGELMQDFAAAAHFTLSEFTSDDSLTRVKAILTKTAEQNGAHVPVAAHHNAGHLERRGGGVAAAPRASAALAQAAQPSSAADVEIKPAKQGQAPDPVGRPDQDVRAQATAAEGAQAVAAHDGKRKDKRLSSAAHPELSGPSKRPKRPSNVVHESKPAVSMAKAPSTTQKAGQASASAAQAPHASSAELDTAEPNPSGAEQVSAQAAKPVKASKAEAAHQAGDASKTQGQGQSAPAGKSAPLPSAAAAPPQAALPSVQKKAKSLKQAAALYDAELPADLVQLEAGINGGSAAETSVAGAEGKAAAVNKQKGHATRQQAALKVADVNEQAQQQEASQAAAAGTTPASAPEAIIAASDAPAQETVADPGEDEAMFEAQPAAEQAVQAKQKKKKKNKKNKDGTGQEGDQPGQAATQAAGEQPSEDDADRMLNNVEAAAPAAEPENAGSKKKKKKDKKKKQKQEAAQEMNNFAHILVSAITCCQAIGTRVWQHKARFKQMCCDTNVACTLVIIVNGLLSTCSTASC